LAALREKHPDAPADTVYPDLPQGGDIVQLQVSEEDVRKAVASFPPGSSGSLDSLSPQHLKDLIGPDGSPELLSSLTSLTNILLDGSIPDHIARVVFGGNLIALNKKGGGIRPITIGYVFRRIAAKCANSFAIERISQALCPIQVGVGKKGRR